MHLIFVLSPFSPCLDEKKRKEKKRIEKECVFILGWALADNIDDSGDQ